MKLIRFPLPLLALGALCSALLTTSLASADEVQTHGLEGINKLDFQITKGDIEIIGSDRPDLELELKEPFTGFDPDTIKQTVERKGDTLVIKIEYEKEKGGWLPWNSEHEGYKSATLHIPFELETKIRTNGGNVGAESMKAMLTMTTSGGNIEASDISAPLELTTSGGNIRLYQISGDTNAHTSGGNINIGDLFGKADLHTSGGNININGKVTALKAHTSGGHINADISTQLMEPLELRTSGGNVNATLHQGTAAPAKLSTSGGSVTLKLPENQAFEVFAKASGGGVSLDHTGSFEGTLDNKRIDGNINGGGPKVTMTTQGGRVRLSEI